MAAERRMDERETFGVGDQSGEHLQLLIGVNRSALSLPAQLPLYIMGVQLLKVGYFTVLLLQMNQRLLGRMRKTIRSYKNIWVNFSIWTNIV